MGQHRRRTRHASRATPSTRSSVRRRLAAVAALAVGFVSVQVFWPAPRAVVTDQPQLISSAAAAVSAPVAAADVSRTAATASQWRADQRSAVSPTDLPQHSGTGRRIVYSVPLQRVWALGEAGRVQRTYLVSGRLSQPLAGHYRVYSRARWTSSAVSAETMQYMVRFTHGTRTGAPIGFHTIPRDDSGHAAQSVDDLGKPLSAGCIRQRLRDAEFLWDFAHIGTSVVVIR